MRKIIALAILVSLFSLQVAGQEIGSIVEDSSKKVPTEAEYRIGVFNLKDEPVEIEMTAQNFQGSVEYEANTFVLEPSRVSSNPSGSGWVSLSGGNYVKPEYQKLSVVGQESQDFGLQVQARRLPENRNSEGPTVVQVVSHSLSYSRTSDSVYLPSGENEENPDLSLERKQEKKGQESNETDDKTLSGRLSILQGEDESNQNQEGNLDLTTILLSLGASGSVLYLWSVL